MVKNRKLVSIGEEVLDKLSVLWEKSDPKPTFAEWVNGYLLVSLEKDEFLRKYAPNISKIGITDNVLTRKDSKKKKYIEIRMVNGKLTSNDNDPIYLQFAWALPELVKLNQKN